MTTLPALQHIPESLGDMVNHQTAAAMARTFEEATAAIKMHMESIEAECDKLARTFEVHGERGWAFNISFLHRGSRDCRTFDDIKSSMMRSAWQCMIHRLGIRTVMSVKDKREFDRQLESGNLPELTEENILGLMGGLVDQAKDFATQAAKEAFDILRPRGCYASEYKTNDSFRVGRRVILPWYVESGWSGSKFRVSYNHEQELIAIDGVFHLLDGKGVMREARGQLVSAINASENGRGETDYFKFKCFKNRNLHLEMKNLELVKELNLLAAGEAVLGEDTEGN